MPVPTTLLLFGEPRLALDRSGRAGRTVTLPEGGKRLIAYAALHRGRLDRRHAAGVLWPGGDDTRATGNLRSALWRLRSAGLTVLEADKRRLWLHPDVAVDEAETRFRVRAAADPGRPPPDRGRDSGFARKRRRHPGSQAGFFSGDTHARRGAMSVRDLSRQRDRPAVVLHVLDGPCLRVDGRPAALPESSLRLLVFLAFRGRPAARRLVAATLWPDADENRAGGNLRSAIWRLRGAGASVLETPPAGLSAGPEVAVDLTPLARWAARITGGGPEPADLRVPAGADGALDLLPGWYDDWVIVERERVRTRVLHALEQVSTLLSAAGRHAEAVDAAITAVCAEPLRESGQVALIRAHLAEGNLIEAQRAFRRYRELLAAELGVAPAPGLWRMIAVARARQLPTMAAR